MDWSYLDPTLTIIMGYSEAMDQTVEPISGEFAINVDGVDKVPDNFVWDSPVQSTITYDEITLGPVVVRLRYSASSPRFQSVAGELITPFDRLVEAP